MRALLALLALLLAVAAPAAQAAQAPRASLPDIEDEVMCLECRTPLNVSTSDVADQQRAFISELIDQGRTKAEIKAALVREYGPRVLGEPEEKGFGLAAWIVPILVALGALALVIVTARRWRREPQPAGAEAAAAPAEGGRELDPEDARRLDAELAAYDR
ncbi:MAG: cytochrome c-type biogenesis protein [Solirubrobacteraceae bacterium]